MFDCRNCDNSLLKLGKSRKRRADIKWPADYECIQKIDDFPDACYCEWYIKITAGQPEEPSTAN